MEIAMREFGDMRRGYARVYMIRAWVRNHVRCIALPSGLLRIGTGRDAADIPFAAIFGRVKSDRPYI